MLILVRSVATSFAGDTGAEAVVSVNLDRENRLIKTGVIQQDGLAISYILARVRGDIPVWEWRIFLLPWATVEFMPEVDLPRALAYMKQYGAQ